MIDTSTLRTALRTLRDAGPGGDSEARAALWARVSAEAGCRPDRLEQGLRGTFGVAAMAALPARPRKPKLVRRAEVGGPRRLRIEGRVMALAELVRQRPGITSAEVMRELGLSEHQLRSIEHVVAKRINKSGVSKQYFPLAAA